MTSPVITISSRFPNGTGFFHTPSTLYPSQIINNNSSGISIQNILFGALAVFLGIASVILAYLQLTHMRTHTHGDIIDLEMSESHQFHPALASSILTLRQATHSDKIPLR